MMSYIDEGNPAYWNGKNPNCKLCDNEIEFMDEYCSEHQRCDECGEREMCYMDALKSMSKKECENYVAEKLKENK